jgi:hypothetical protein|uniref:Uncharacterized protein n=1 Tax=Micromonas pusilla TaxID=38833 RepID=A0A7S0DD15_MICPS|mmetsp:Transcript_7930/g.33779  ORF Transcript_7930/g.33779 Transcript_7930/m.33779 type:complete len:277 (+) Transcript_7930:182-1012(+)
MASSFAIIAPLRVSAGFRLDDGLGRDRKARANRRRAVFGDDVTHRVNPRRDDLLDGPSRRVGRGRASVSPSHEASRARTAHLRDAKSPTLGLLDELGERAARSGPARLAAGPKGANTKPPESRAKDSRADVPYSVSSFAAAARWRRFAGTDFDVFDVPGGRARRGETSSSSRNSRRASVRAAFAANSDRANSNSSSEDKARLFERTPPRHQRSVLGILTAPSARVGRAARRGAAGGDGTRDRKERGREPYRAGANAAEPLLGILSGPGKRVGRKHK